MPTIFPSGHQENPFTLIDSDQNWLLDISCSRDGPPPQLPIDLAQQNSIASSSAAVADRTLRPKSHHHNYHQCRA